MKKNEKLRNNMAQNIFAVVNMAAHYNITLPDEIEDFMEDWFMLDASCEATEYSFDELSDFIDVALDIATKHPEFTKEPMVAFPLAELKKMKGKTEEQLLESQKSHFDLWDDMDNVSSVGLDSFLNKHIDNAELQAAMNVIAAFLP